jgi:hypothetical protein
LAVCAIDPLNVSVTVAGAPVVVVGAVVVEWQPASAVAEMSAIAARIAGRLPMTKTRVEEGMRTDATSKKSA